MKVSEAMALLKNKENVGIVRPNFDYTVSYSDLEDEYLIYSIDRQTGDDNVNFMVKEKIELFLSQFLEGD